MAVSSSTTARPMSTDSSRSRTNGGSGTIIRSTTAMTAAGASRCEARKRERGSGVGVGMASEHQLFEANEISEDFGHSAEEIGWNRVADFGVLGERPGERHVLDDGH